MCGAVLRDPAVVGIEAGFLVVEVLVVAQQHAHRRIYHFGRDAVAILIEQTRVRIPTAAMQILELDAGLGDLVRQFAGGRHEPEMNRPVHAVDDEHVAVVVRRDDVRRAVAKRAIDVLRVRIGMLGDV